MKFEWGEWQSTMVQGFGLFCRRSIWGDWEGIGIIFLFTHHRACNCSSTAHGPRGWATREFWDQNGGSAKKMKMVKCECWICWNGINWLGSGDWVIEDSAWSAASFPFSCLLLPSYYVLCRVVGGHCSPDCCGCFLFLAENNKTNWRKGGRKREEAAADSRAAKSAQSPILH